MSAQRTIEQEVCPRCLNVWANCPTWGRCLKPTDDCLRYAGEAMAREPVAYFFTNHPAAQAEIEKLRTERDEWAQKAHDWRAKYAELRYPGMKGVVRPAAETPPHQCHCTEPCGPDGRCVYEKQPVETSAQSK